MDDEEARKYVIGAGVHWYVKYEIFDLSVYFESNQTISSPLRYSPGFYSEISQVSTAYPGFFVLATEACEGYLPVGSHVKLGDWDRADAYMADIIAGMFIFIFIIFFNY
jgi:glucosylceramidase